MITVVGTVKGSGGATVSALALTAALAADGDDATLIEADPSGGSLIGWCPQLAPAPCLYDAVFARDGTGFEQARQRLGDGHVVVAGGNPYRIDAALQRPQGRWSPLLATLPGSIVIDVGRITHGSPTAGLLWHADRVLLATAAEAVPIAATVEWAARGGEVHAGDARVDPDRIRIITVDVSARHRWRLDPRRVSDELGSAHIAHLPFDDNGLDLLCRGASVNHRSLRRSDLVDAARHLPATIAEPRAIAWT